MSPRRRRAAALVVAFAATVAAGLAGVAAASAPEWNIARVGAPASGAGALIAVVDTGVDGAHPALAGRVRPTIDLVGGGEGDANGHGTHVAGTAAGADSGCGAIGVAPAAQILPVRVLDAEGEGTVDDVAEGIRRAADAGATVVNLSLGTDVVLRSVSGSGLQEAIEYAWSKGAIPVLAAGNDGIFGGLLGSGYGDIPAVVVTATDHQDRVASYATSIGSAEWGIAAPGGDTSGEVGRDILSAFPDRRCALHAGTSMAAPHVSGALAELRSRGLGPQRAVEHLLATARDLGASGPDGTYGHGLVDLGAAIGALSATPPAPPDTAPPAPTDAGGGSPPPAPTADPAPAPPAGDGDAVRDERAAGDDPAATPNQGAAEPRTPRSTPEDRDDADVDDSAQAVIEDERGDDVPGALVAVAVAALGMAGTGSALAARTLRRRL